MVVVTVCVGTAMTAKLVISFVQVVGGSFVTVHIDWPRHAANMFSFLSVNPLHALESTYMCSDSHSNDHPYFVGILLHFLAPFAFLSLLLAVASTVRCVASRVYVNTFSSAAAATNRDTTSSAATNRDTTSFPMKSGTVDESDAQRRLDWAVWNTCGKLYLWFCLITYPSISSRFAHPTITF
jgi:hypothetical protein